MRSNNLDTLRFLGAFAVLWGHTFLLDNASQPKDPLAAWSQGQTAMGTMAVATFFIISGYLVTRSFEHSISAWRFVKARALRLMPPLVAAVFLAVFVVGPLVATQPAGTYFTSFDVWKYIAVNLSLLGFYDRLPGVFTGNPLPSINGSMWTLQLEAQCYGMIFLLGIVGLLSRYVTAALFTVGLVWLALDGPYHNDNFSDWNHRVNLTTNFLAGAVAYHWRLQLKAPGLIVVALATVLSFRFGGFWIACPTVFALLVLWIGFAAPRLPNLATYGDLSYGVYIYSFPMTQMLVHYRPTMFWYELGMLASAMTLILAFVSWHTIEKFALSFKDTPMMPMWLRPHLWSFDVRRAGLEAVPIPSMEKRATVPR